MATREFLLPDLGEGLEDAEIVQWLVAVGDRVQVDQPLLEVETAKANVEVPSPFAGTVVALHGEAGTVVPVGAALVTIDDAQSGGDTVSATEAEPELQPVRFVASSVIDAPTPARPLVGYGEGAGGGRRRRRRRREHAPVGVVSESGARARAMPPVRKLARDLGVRIDDVHGSGLGGLVTRADVRAAADRGLAATALRSTPRVANTGTPSAERVPVRGVRRAMADKLTRSHREIPVAHTWIDADATELLALRDEMNASQDTVRVTPLALVLRACVAGLRRHPILNARWDEAAGEIEVLAGIHMGFAAQTERGLVVPVIHDAHERSTLELAEELNRLAAAAREGALTPADLTGGTFTVSNYGSFGVDGGTAIINHPEVAILGVGAFTKKPWVHGDEIVTRTIVELSLSFDHRVCDGSDAGAFTRFVADCAASPAALLAVL